MNKNNYVISKIIFKFIKYNFDFVLFFFGKLCLKFSYLGIFLYLYFCNKFLQARYLFTLFNYYLFVNGISFIHFKLQYEIFINWLFWGRKFEVVLFTTQHC